MKIYKPKGTIKLLSLIVAFSIMGSACSAQAGIWSIFGFCKKVPKPQKISKISMLLTKFTKPATLIGVLLVGGAFIAGTVFGKPIFNWFSNLINNGNNTNNGGDDDKPDNDGSLADDVPHGRRDDEKHDEHKNTIVRSKLDDLRDWAKRNKCIISQKVLKTGTITNHIYQIKCSEQEGMTCGPCALCNAAILRKHFSGTIKDKKTMLENLNELIDGTTQNKVVPLYAEQDLELTRLFSVDQLVDAVSQGQVDGLNSDVISIVQSPAIYYRAMLNPNASYSSAEKKFVSMNITNKPDGFSYSFVLNSVDSEREALNGHWITIHVYKHDGAFYWFVVCSMNFDQLDEPEYGYERITFIIRKLLGQSVSDMDFYENRMAEVENDIIDNIDEIPQRLENILNKNDIPENLPEEEIHSRLKGQFQMLVADLFRLKVRAQTYGLTQEIEKAGTMLKDIKEKQLPDVGKDFSDLVIKNFEFTENELRSYEERYKSTSDISEIDELETIKKRIKSFEYGPFREKIADIIQNIDKKINSLLLKIQ